MIDVSSGNRYYYFYDGLGSVAALLDNRQIVKRCRLVDPERAKRMINMSKIGNCGAVEKVDFIKNICRFVLRNKDDFSFLMVFQPPHCPRFCMPTSSEKQYRTKRPTVQQSSGDSKTARVLMKIPNMTPRQSMS